MNFTDDDLKRLKEHLVIDEQFHVNSVWVEREWTKALIARLEAAESIAFQSSLQLEMHDKDLRIEYSSTWEVLRNLLEVWRKAAGR